MNAIILASSSPRRKQLLEQIKIPFTIKVPNIDESLVSIKNPVERVRHLAEWKAESLPLRSEKEIILAADTVVSYRDAIFEKPSSKEEAFQMIQALSGESHQVMTGVCLRTLKRSVTFHVVTEVEFWELSRETIEAYVNTDEPYDKAGAYGIQAMGKLFVKAIHGDYDNVVGLPISHVVQELTSFGFSMKDYF